jgi:hypothetical protein
VPPGFPAPTAAIGAEPWVVSVYQIVLFASVLFHHSNTRLPVGVERELVCLVVTPRMHGIHHSDYRNETNTNWSSLLSVWDYLHGTARLVVPQSEIVIGVPRVPRSEGSDSRKGSRAPLQAPARGLAAAGRLTAGPAPPRPGCHDASAVGAGQALNIPRTLCRLQTPHADSHDQHDLTRPARTPDDEVSLPRKTAVGIYSPPV